MAKVIHKTYNSNDCTSVGYLYSWSAGRLTATKRSCWQGSRSNVRISLGKCTLAEAPDMIKNIERDRIENLCRLEDIYPVTSKGYVVH